ncbi:hypothetical protein L484_006288 [Morus notabilis]|uniref:Uncharacterized protein n=1 Tax=Morus notabilis TaxID=981085 RepID=W9QUL4_9ROSA|nr:hypothetical protein L484_006288 [Morus notabilis]
MRIRKKPISCTSPKNKKNSGNFFRTTFGFQILLDSQKPVKSANLTRREKQSETSEGHFGNLVVRLCVVGEDDDESDEGSA